MLVYLGQGVSIHGEDIIALTDLQHYPSPQARLLMEQFRSQGRLQVLGASPKTMVICRQNTHCVCYLSCVGLRTLRQRVEERQRIETREVQHG